LLQGVFLTLSAPLPITQPLPLGGHDVAAAFAGFVGGLSHLGFGRIVASEIEIPDIFVNLV
jgi:hypothetical protein